MGILDELIQELSKLPGIGRKSAQRIGFYLLKIPEEEVIRLASTIESAKRKLKFCPICFNLTETDPCEICSDSRRDRSTICVVEEPSDVIALDRIKEYRGLYHVLHGAISPLDGVGPEKLKVRELIDRLKGGEAKEVILATNPDAEGEATAIYLGKLLKPLGVKVTRIARGLPVGSDLDYADEVTLSRALEGRKEV
ncbi:recombinase RecR [candidate division TA06 bacterium DG_26]|uniref:Recombination protein RecR n=1 Tax=candidate division TA06 bacterium DG_26 TaxID=1703771 RepID=A0A0S7WLG3_UNCT6|nr:MAG: recombinase RecR [candidate division TA06 bacterium DG_26]